MFAFEGLFKMSDVIMAVGSVRIMDVVIHGFVLNDPYGWL